MTQLSWAEIEWIRHCTRRGTSVERCARWISRSRREVLAAAHAAGLYFTSARERQTEAWRRKRLRAWRDANRRWPLPLAELDAAQ